MKTQFWLHKKISYMIKIRMDNREISYKCSSLKHVYSININHIFISKNIFYKLDLDLLSSENAFHSRVNGVPISFHEFKYMAALYLSSKNGE